MTQTKKNNSLEHTNVDKATFAQIYSFINAAIVSDNSRMTVRLNATIAILSYFRSMYEHPPKNPKFYGQFIEGVGLRVHRGSIIKKGLKNVKGKMKWVSNFSESTERNATWVLEAMGLLTPTTRDEWGPKCFLTNVLYFKMNWERVEAIRKTGALPMSFDEAVKITKTPAFKQRDIRHVYYNSNSDIRDPGIHIPGLRGGSPGEPRNSRSDIGNSLKKENIEPSALRAFQLMVPFPKKNSLSIGTEQNMGTVPGSEQPEYSNSPNIGTASLMEQSDYNNPGTVAGSEQPQPGDVVDPVISGNNINPEKNGINTTMEQSNTINPVSEPPKGSHCACGTNGTNPVQGLEYSPGKGRKPKLTPARVRFLQKNQHGTSTANDPVWQARYKESNKKLGRSARTLYPKFTRYENQFSLDYTANYDGGWLANSHTCQLHMSRLHGWLDTHFAGILKYTARECSEFIKAMTKDKYRRVNMHLLLKRADGGANEFTRLGELNALIEVARRTKIKTNGHRHWGHSQQDSQYLTLADHGPGAYADGTFSEDEMVALQKELTRLRYDWVSWNINPSFYELWVGKSETEIRKVEAEWEKGIECVTEIARANKANLANT